MNIQARSLKTRLHSCSELLGLQDSLLTSFQTAFIFLTLEFLQETKAPLASNKIIHLPCLSQLLSPNIASVRTWTDSNLLGLTLTPPNC